MANHHFLIKRIAGTSIEKPRFTSFLYPGETFLFLRFMQIFTNLFLLDSVEYRGRHFESECLRGNSQMGFQNLADVHAARYAQRIEHNFNRRSIRQKGHVLFRNDACNHAFVPVATGHLVTDTQLALACDINLNLRSEEHTSELQSPMYLV